MSDARPDPDRLLARVQREEAQAGRGKLKIFFGASAGVGKTYSMLAAARQQLDQGTDVVIGIVETHGRTETAALLADLPRLPMRDVAHRERVLQEFDLDAALQRHPQLILVDELAHSNAPGSRHPKRWQDVEELLEAGIDVWSTVNVQHLESLNDIVGGITGIRVWETVPDRVFDQADEVVIVDLPPDELLARLQQGKVYLADQAERAVRNFFRKGNLIALRELALRRIAERVDGDVLRWRRERAVGTVWHTQEALLACIGPQAGADRVVRRAARLAARLEAPWHAIYVETPALQRLPDAERQRVLRVLQMAEDMGATTANLADADPVAAAVRYAREHNLARVVVGHASGRGASSGDVGWLARAWERLWAGRAFAARLAAAAPDLDVLQVARPAPDERQAGAGGVGRGAPAHIDWPAYGWSMACCAVAALAAAPLHGLVDLANIVMLFLLAVVVVAVRFGRGPAVLAAFVSVAGFDFLYVPPRLSFAVSDVQYLLTFGVMLVVALVTGQLTAGLKFQARVALAREARVRSLYAMSRDLTGALAPEQIVELCARFLEAEFGARTALLLADDAGRLQPVSDGREGHAPLPVDAGIAQWAYDHAEPAGLGTDTLPASPVLYVPLRAPMRTRGVLALQPAEPGRLMAPEQRRLLETFASVAAIALERLHFVEVAQSSTLQMESERLRNSLLAALSHDLRTPLAALVALADSMALTQPPPTGAQAEIASAMAASARRMAALVENLLDMARLQAGAVHLDLQWQPLEEVVGSALAASEPALAAHRVHTALPADLPLVRFDAVLIERVLCNLLENAAKYTPPGSHIEVGAAVLPASEQGEAGGVEVWVADDGPGLPAGREEEVFRKFERGDKEGSTPGVGLGLAICRAIVEAHGGTIHAEQRARTFSRSGACLRFTLPGGRPPEVEAEPAPAAAQAA